MLDNDVVRGGERNYYSVRLIILCMAASAVVAAAITFGVAALIASNVKDTTYRGAVAACERGNKVRSESNRRIKEHTLDRDNLRKLATALSANRAAEANTFAAIGGAFDIDAKVRPLVKLLREASATDQRIADLQGTVTFEKLHLVPCHNTHFVPHP